MPVLHAGRFPYVHRHLYAKLFSSFLISTLVVVPSELNLPAYDITRHLTKWLKVPNSCYHCR